MSDILQRVVSTVSDVIDPIASTVSTVNDIIDDKLEYYERIATIVGSVLFGILLLTLILVSATLGMVVKLSKK